MVALNLFSFWDQAKRFFFGRFNSRRVYDDFSSNNNCLLSVENRSKYKSFLLYACMKLSFLSETFCL